MKVASGQASGARPTPELAEAAVRSALARAGLERASHVVLLLSREFTRQPGPSILAAARAAGCLQVGGGTANGLFTEAGWLLDQPAAVALVIGDDDGQSVGPSLAFSGHGTLPFDWQDGQPRAGLLEPDAAAWAHGRLAANSCAEFRLPGRCVDICRSTGLRPLGDKQPVDQAEGYELRRIGGQAAVDSLHRALPAELRESFPLHQVALQRQADEPAIALLAANADGSLTLAAPVAAGDKLAWAIRQPLAAEQEMRGAFKAAAENGVAPDFALMFSCIGRGPLFYGNDDLDLQAFRAQFPGTPLLGAYGSAQVVPLAAGSRLFHNSVLTLLFASTDV